jgi:SAM-dependent methyltransferase
VDSVSLAELHRERDRAEGFGAAAEAYERHRPEFPGALLDDLAKLGDPRGPVLDIATGTGKVARGLIARGRTVLGVELDPRMAAVAAHSGVDVEVARFEEWSDAGRRFELVTCGDAWHWLEPTRAAEKVAAVLNPGCTLARFWNLQLLDEAVVAALAPVYREHAPEVFVYGSPQPLPDLDPLLTLAGPFTPVEERTYESERMVSREEWSAFVATISDHKRLSAERLSRLQAGIVSAVSAPIRVRMVTGAFFARRL